MKDKTISNQFMKPSIFFVHLEFNLDLEQHQVRPEPEPEDLVPRRQPRLHHFDVCHGRRLQKGELH